MSLKNVHQNLKVKPYQFDPFFIVQHQHYKKSGLDGKLPVNIRDANGAQNIAVYDVFTNPDTLCIRDNLITLWAQNDSSTRAWCKTLLETGLCEASTGNTLRLQPNDGLFSPKTTIRPKF